MTSKLFPLLVALALTTKAIAADLDAPAIKPVTVRSEIERGVDALSNAPIGDPLRLYRFVDALLSANKQKNTDTDGFQFGVYYSAWHDSWQIASLGLRHKADQGMAESNARIYHLFAAALAKRLKLTSDQIQLLGGRYVPGEETRFPQIAKSGKFKGTYVTGERMKPSTEISAAGKK